MKAQQEKSAENKDRKGMVQEYRLLKDLMDHIPDVIYFKALL